MFSKLYFILKDVFNFDENIFTKYDKVYALILSWNISDIVKNKLKELNSNIQFLEI